jgi:hypothetical protein
MTKTAKRKTKTSKSKQAKAKSSWGDVMKKALEEKRVVRRGPDQPKPRDSGTFKVKKDSIR